MADVDVELAGRSFQGAIGGRFEFVIVDTWEFESDPKENGELELLE